jgi:hypothetical protein
VAFAAFALGGAVAADGVEFADEFVDALLDFAAVGFELGFAFAAAHADAAFLAGKVGPEPGQARQQMLQLGQFDLQLAFPGAGALSEDVEDQLGAIEDLEFEHLFEAAALAGRQLVIEDDGIDLDSSWQRVANSWALPGPMNVLAVGFSIFWVPVADDIGAGGLGELTEFGEGILDVPVGSRLELGADEEGAFAGLDGVFGDKGLQSGNTLNPPGPLWQRRVGPERPVPRPERPVPAPCASSLRRPAPARKAV